MPHDALTRIDYLTGGYRSYETVRSAWIEALKHVLVPSESNLQNSKLLGIYYEYRVFLLTVYKRRQSVIPLVEARSLIGVFAW